jgi:uncharacterized membrane protein
MAMAWSIILVGGGIVLLVVALVVRSKKAGR